MRAVVTNYGVSTHFPTHDGNIFLSSRETRQIEVSQVAFKELSKFRFIKIESVEKEEEPEAVAQAEVELPGPDLESMKVPALKALAKGKGIKGFEGMKKQELLDILKET